MKCRCSNNKKPLASETGSTYSFILRFLEMLIKDLSSSQFVTDSSLCLLAGLCLGLRLGLED